MKAAIHLAPLLGIVLAIIAPYEPPSEVPPPEALTGGVTRTVSRGAPVRKSVWRDAAVQQDAAKRAYARVTNALKMSVSAELQPTVDYVDGAKALERVNNEWKGVVSRLMAGDDAATIAALTGWARSAPAIYLPATNRIIVMPDNAEARAAEAGKSQWQDADSLALVLSDAYAQGVLLSRYPEIKSALLGRTQQPGVDAILTLVQGHAQAALVSASKKAEGENRLSDTAQLLGARAKLETAEQDGALATLYKAFQTARRKGFSFVDELTNKPRKQRTEILTNPPEDMTPFDDPELFFNPPPTFEAETVMAELSAHLNVGSWKDVPSALGQEGLVFVFTAKDKRDALATHLKGVRRLEARQNDGAGVAERQIYWFAGKGHARKFLDMLNEDYTTFDAQMSGERKPASSKYSEGAGFGDELMGWTNVRTFSGDEEVQQITSVFTHDRFVVVYSVRAEGITREDVDEAVTNSNEALTEFARTWDR